MRRGTFLPLGLSLLLAGCNFGPGEEQRAAAVQKREAEDKAEIAKAEQAVRAKLGADATFSGLAAYVNEDEPVVCGSVTATGGPAKKFISVSSGQKLFVEGETSAADMATNTTEYCQNYSRIESDSAPDSTDL